MGERWDEHAKYFGSLKNKREVFFKKTAEEKGHEYIMERFSLLSKDLSRQESLGIESKICCALWEQTDWNILNTSLAAEPDRTPAGRRYGNFLTTSIVTGAHKMIAMKLDKKPHKCKICNACFSRRQSLERHIREQHQV
jgi:hypothetical protein